MKNLVMISMVMFALGAFAQETKKEVVVEKDRAQTEVIKHKRSHSAEERPLGTRPAVPGRKPGRIDTQHKSCAKKVHTASSRPAQTGSRSDMRLRYKKRVEAVEK